MIVATRGDFSFLLREGNMGRVWDSGSKRISRLLPFDSILARGYWKEWEGTEEERESIEVEISKEAIRE